MVENVESHFLCEPHASYYFCQASLMKYVGPWHCGNALTGAIETKDFQEFYCHLTSMKTRTHGAQSTI